jgi:hypothetical protein
LKQTGKKCAGWPDSANFHFGYFFNRKSSPKFRLHTLFHGKMYVFKLAKNIFG